MTVTSAEPAAADIVRALRLPDIVKELTDPSSRETLLEAIHLQQAGEVDAASARYKAIWERDEARGLPPNPAVRYLLALVAHMVNDHELAVRLMTEALDLRPTWVEATYNLAVIHMHLGHYVLAEELLRRAERLDPTAVPVHNNLGNCLLARGQMNEALAAFDRALELKPASLEERWNRGHVHFMKGDWLSAWADFECRWAIAGFRAHNSVPPMLPRLRSLEQLRPGSRVIVAHEQGYGDSIQMLRYIPALLRTGALVYTRVQKGLTRLVTHGLMANFVDEAMSAPLVVADGQDTPEDERLRLGAGYAVPTMSLPYVFGTTALTVPYPEGYLCGASRYGPLEPAGGIVGVCWAGSPDHKNNRNRSIDLETLEFSLLPALRDRGARLVALAQLETPPAGFVSALSPGTDWYDTAQVIAELNLVITVDTAVAHLAGALGVPCWVLLPTPNDFRWGLRRHRSPWYKSVRLFRQSVGGEWSKPLREVRDAFFTLPLTRKG